MLLHPRLKTTPSVDAKLQIVPNLSFSIDQVGPRSCGKTSLVHLVAQLTGNRLEVMAMNSAMDTTELLGGFEQVG